MSSTFTTIDFQHRFAGPKNFRLVPYARPDIVGLWINDIEEDHAIIRFGRRTNIDKCWIDLGSERDEELEGYWSGTEAELSAMISGRYLSIWNIRILMSAKMTKVLTNYGKV
jgi:hypothetical protein